MRLMLKEGERVVRGRYLSGLRIDDETTVWAYKTTVAVYGISTYV